MSRADGLPFSSNGQSLALPVDRNPQHGLSSAGIQGDANATPPHQTSQPGTHGASAVDRDAILEGDRQIEVGRRYK